MKKSVIRVFLWLMCLIYITPVKACRDARGDGFLSDTFGMGGLVTTDFDRSNDKAHGLVVLPCGRIVAVGGSNEHRYNYAYNFALVGYTSLGIIDTGFGINGKVLTDFSDISGNTKHPGFSSDYAFAATLQKDCHGCDNRCACALNPCRSFSDFDFKIVAVGSSNATPSGNYAFALARYTSNGSLDTRFNGNGRVVTPIGVCSQAQAVAIQADNKIVVAGYSTNTCGKKNFALARYKCDGTLDSTFGCHGTGIVVTNFSDCFGQALCSEAFALKIQKNGKIVIGGYTTFNRGERHFALARYTPNGRLDRSFGPNRDGKVTTFLGGCDAVIRALVLQEECSFGCIADDKIVAVGYSDFFSSHSHKRPSAKHDKNNRHFTLIRYLANGQIDKTFGIQGTGIVTTDFASSSGKIHKKATSAAYAAIVTNHGDKHASILVAGVACDGFVGSRSRFALASYKPDGCLNDTFGIKGKITTAFSPSSCAQAYAIAFQQNGKILLGGFTNAQDTNDFALARYNFNKFCPGGCPKRTITREKKNNCSRMCLSTCLSNGNCC